MNWNSPYAWLLLGLVLLTLVLIWVPTRFRYRVTASHLEVRFLGFCVRRVSFENIERVSKKPPTFSENWSNTYRPGSRQLVVHRKRGLLKEFVITPRNRYLFKAQLEAAMRGEVLSLAAEPVETVEGGVAAEG